MSRAMAPISSIPVSKNAQMTGDTLTVIQKRSDDVRVWFEKQQREMVPQLTTRINAIDKQLRDMELHTCVMELNEIEQARGRLTIKRRQLDDQRKGLMDNTLLTQFQANLMIAGADVVAKQKQIQMEQNIEIASIVTGKRLKRARDPDILGTTHNKQLLPLQTLPISMELDPSYDDERTEDVAAEPTDLPPSSSSSSSSISAALSLLGPMGTTPATALQFQMLKELKVPMETLIIRPKSMTTSLKARNKQLAESNTHFCRACHSALFFLASESKLVCKRCSLTEDYIDTSAVSQAVLNNNAEYIQNYHDSFTHLLNVMEPFIPRQDVVIEPWVYDNIIDFVRTVRFEQTRYFNFAKTVAILKHLKMNEYCPFKIQITCELNNQRYPILTLRQEQRIVFCFIEMHRAFESIRRQQAFAHHELNDEPRFATLKYGFFLHQIFTLLKYYEFIPYCKLLRVPARALKQMQLMIRIFEVMGIPYEP